MTGTIRQDQNGSWWFQFTTKVNGERRAVRRRGFATKRDASRTLAEMLADYGRGDRRAIVAPSAQSLGDYLDSWLTARRGGLKASTAASYATLARVYLAPLRGIPLRDLTGPRIARWAADLARRGGKGGRALSPRTVAYASRVLTMALGDAVEGGQLARSPMDEIPRRQRPTRHRARQQLGKVWTGPEARTFLAATVSDRLAALWALLLDSGCRRGEALGLRWSDVGDTGVEFARSRVLVDDDVIEGTPKSGKARRVELDPRTMTALRQHRARQAAERLAAGAAYASGPYVFTSELGEPLRPGRCLGQIRAPDRPAGRRHGALARLAPHIGDLGPGRWRPAARRGRAPRA